MSDVTRVGIDAASADNGEEDRHICPICIELLDETDRGFYPCECGYQICLWCLYNIRSNMDNKCPACRREYDESNFRINKDETSGGGKSNSKKKKEKWEKEKGDRSAAASVPSAIRCNSQNFEALKDVRVIQRNLVYVIGLPQAFAKKEVLRRPEFFGQYGTVVHMVVNRSQVYNSVWGGSSYSVYVTYANNQEALTAIQEINGATFEKRTLRASFGTTKYCSYFLRNTKCANTDCFYLHQLGNDKDSFTKEDMIAARHQFHDLTFPVQIGRDNPRKEGGGPRVQTFGARYDHSVEQDSSKMINENENGQSTPPATTSLIASKSQNTRNSPLLLPSPADGSNYQTKEPIFLTTLPPSAFSLERNPERSTSLSDKILWGAAAFPEQEMNEADSATMGGGGLRENIRRLDESMFQGAEQMEKVEKLEGGTVVASSLSVMTPLLPLHPSISSPVGMSCSSSDAPKEIGKPAVNYSNLIGTNTASVYPTTVSNTRGNRIKINTRSDERSASILGEAAAADAVDEAEAAYPLPVAANAPVNKLQPSAGDFSLAKGRSSTFTKRMNEKLSKDFFVGGPAYSSGLPPPILSSKGKRTPRRPPAGMTIETLEDLVHPKGNPSSASPRSKGHFSAALLSNAHRPLISGQSSPSTDFVDSFTDVASGSLNSPLPTMTDTLLQGSPLSHLSGSFSETILAIKGGPAHPPSKRRLSNEKHLPAPHHGHAANAAPTVPGISHPAGLSRSAHPLMGSVSVPNSPLSVNKGGASKRMEAAVLTGDETGANLSGPPLLPSPRAYRGTLGTGGAGRISLYPIPPGARPPTTIAPLSRYPRGMSSTSLQGSNISHRTMPSSIGNMNEEVAANVQPRMQVTHSHPSGYSSSTAGELHIPHALFRTIGNNANLDSQMSIKSSISPSMKSPTTSENLLHVVEEMGRGNGMMEPIARALNQYNGMTMNENLFDSPFESILSNYNSRFYSLQEDWRPFDCAVPSRSPPSRVQPERTAVLGSGADGRLDMARAERKYDALSLGGALSESDLPTISEFNSRSHSMNWLHPSPNAQSRFPFAAKYQQEVQEDEYFDIPGIEDGLHMMHCDSTAPYKDSASAIAPTVGITLNNRTHYHGVDSAYPTRSAASRDIVQATTSYYRKLSHAVTSLPTAHAPSDAASAQVSVGTQNMIRPSVTSGSLSTTTATSTSAAIPYSPADASYSTSLATSAISPSNYRSPYKSSTLPDITLAPGVGLRAIAPANPVSVVSSNTMHLLKSLSASSFEKAVPPIPHSKNPHSSLSCAAAWSVKPDEEPFTQEDGNPSARLNTQAFVHQEGSDPLCLLKAYSTKDTSA